MSSPTLLGCGSVQYSFHLERKVAFFLRGLSIRSIEFIEGKFQIYHGSEQLMKRTSTEIYLIYPNYDYTDYTYRTDWND